MQAATTLLNLRGSISQGPLAAKCAKLVDECLDKAEQEFEQEEKALAAHWVPDPGGVAAALRYPSAMDAAAAVSTECHVYAATAALVKSLYTNKCRIAFRIGNHLNA